MRHARGGGDCSDAPAVAGTLHVRPRRGDSTSTHAHGFTADTPIRTLVVFAHARRIMGVNREFSHTGAVSTAVAALVDGLPPRPHRL